MTVRGCYGLVPRLQSRGQAGEASALQDSCTGGAAEAQLLWAPRSWVVGALAVGSPTEGAGPVTPREAQARASTVLELSKGT